MIAHCIAGIIIIFLSEYQDSRVRYETANLLLCYYATGYLGIC